MLAWDRERGLPLAPPRRIGITKLLGEEGGGGEEVSNKGVFSFISPSDAGNAVAPAPEAECG